LIPLELGGAPRNPKNLWPEPRAQARRSDPLKTKLERQVLARRITLNAARAAIRRLKYTTARDYARRRAIGLRLKGGPR
jgi:hypothetical protein